jgi:hypothetical protein
MSRISWSFALFSQKKIPCLCCHAPKVNVHLFDNLNVVAKWQPRRETFETWHIETHRQGLKTEKHILPVSEWSHYKVWVNEKYAAWDRQNHVKKSSLIGRFFQIFQSKNKLPDVNGKRWDAFCHSLVKDRPPFYSAFEKQELPRYSP